MKRSLRALSLALLAVATIGCSGKDHGPKTPIKLPPSPTPTAVKGDPCVAYARDHSKDDPNGEQLYTVTVSYESNTRYADQHAYSGTAGHESPLVMGKSIFVDLTGADFEKRGKKLGHVSWTWDTVKANPIGGIALFQNGPAQVISASKTSIGVPDGQVLYFLKLCTEKKQG